MPDSDSAVIEAPVEETRDLKGVFDNALGENNDIYVETPEKEKVVEKKEQPKKTEKKGDVRREEKKVETAIPDILDFVPEPDKKVEEDTDPEPTPIPENIKSEPARKAFADLDAKRIESQKKARELEKKLKLAEEKASQGDPDAKIRIGQLEDQLRNADSLVQRAMLQEHPQFQAKYVLPRQQLLNQAKQAFQDAGGDPNQIESALELKGKARVDKLDELLGEVSSKILLGKLEGAVNMIDRIDTEKDAVLKNSAAYNKKLQEQDAINRSKQFEQLEKATKENLSKASEILRDKFNIALFKTFDDPKFEDWNKERDKIHSVAEHIMLKTENPEEMAMAAQMAAGFPRAYALFVNEHKAHLETKKRLADYEKSEPGLGRSSAPSPDSEETEEDVPLATAIIASVKKSQGR